MVLMPHCVVGGSCARVGVLGSHPVRSAVRVRINMLVVKTCMGWSWWILYVFLKQLVLRGVE